jgi:hypothetical protein
MFNFLSSSVSGQDEDGRDEPTGGKHPAQVHQKQGQLHLCGSVNHNFRTNENTNQHERNVPFFGTTKADFERVPLEDSVRAP